MGASRVLFLIISISAAAIVPAMADELVMPFACTTERGSPRLTAAEPTAYEIIGSREDMPFSACRSLSSGHCETMMIHKFSITCGGQKIAWSKVAAAGPAAGVDLPGRLPSGFAPVSRFKGRFVLPGFGRTTRLPKVETQTLSADSVIQTGSIASDSEEKHWVTVIDPAIQASASGGAFKIAGVVSTLLMSLMAACLFVARRRLPFSYDFARAPYYSENAPENFWRSGARTAAALANACWRCVLSVFERSQPEPSGTGSASVSSLWDAVQARIAETELLVAALPADLLLRDVLQAELDGLRGKAADVLRRSDQLGDTRMTSLLRGMLKDIDRITRIVHGTARKDEAAKPTAGDVPSTVFEAYRILGLNPEAPPVAVKKVVDALRMSWHPDHARSEPDRRHREERIKQINAAWDLLKAAQAKAA
jgi:hypothetical protein